eukprot:5642719-Prymnesium_polylepis.1
MSRDAVDRHRQDVLRRRVPRAKGIHARVRSQVLRTGAALRCGKCVDAPAMLARLLLSSQRQRLV